MDFTQSTRSSGYARELRSFLDEVITPAEGRVAEEIAAEPGTVSATLEHLKTEAKSAGLWNLCVRDPDCGPGLSFVDYAPLAEMLGTSRVAQEALNCDAPSSINADALLIYGSDEQKERWLRPQLDGMIRSAFAMTEPDTASSDASNIAMEASPVADGWVLNGRKWYISGVMHPSCAYLMVLATTDTSASSGRHGRHSVFIVPRDTPGLTVVRDLPKFGYFDVGHGHAELDFDQVRLPDSALLGQVGGGFAIGQARLGPARVQHCMRSIGIAEAALALMCQRAQQRSTFGALVSTRSNVMDWVADARIQIEAARLLTLRTAWLMDNEGDKAAAPTMSLLKVHVLEAACSIVDRAIQVHGAAGVSDDTPLANWYASLRSLRIADGPDEVHRMVIARRELRRHQTDS